MFWKWSEFMYARDFGIFISNFPHFEGVLDFSEDFCVTLCMLSQYLWSQTNSYKTHILFAGLNGSVGCASYWWSGGRGFGFMQIDHEIFSAVIIFLPLIRICQFLATECTQVLVNPLEDLACPGKSVPR